MELTGINTRPRCPTCSAPLTKQLRYEGEPVPAGIVAMVNVTPRHIAEIRVTCDTGHTFTARSHTVSLSGGTYTEEYKGLAPLYTV